LAWPGGQKPQALAPRLFAIENRCWVAVVLKRGGAVLVTVVLVAASVEVKIELNESMAPAAIKMLKVRIVKVRIVIPPNIFLQGDRAPNN
jgi:predicted metal-dependent RNase